MTDLTSQTVAAADDYQAVVREGWEHFVGLTPAGTDDFYDCGGNSLVALQLFGRIYKAMGVRVSMKRFQHEMTFDALLGEVVGKMASRERVDG